MNNHGLPIGKEETKNSQTRAKQPLGIDLLDQNYLKISLSSTDNVLSY